MTGLLYSKLLYISFLPFSCAAEVESTANQTRVVLLDNELEDSGSEVSRRGGNKRKRPNKHHRRNRKNNRKHHHDDQEDQSGELDRFSSSASGRRAGGFCQPIKSNLTSCQIIIQLICLIQGLAHHHLKLKW